LYDLGVAHWLERKNMSELNEVFCPACKLKNESFARVCVHCQTPLPVPEGNILTTKRMGGKTKLFDTEELLKNADIPEDGIILMSQESGQEIARIVEEKFILGRAVEGVEESVIDLSPFGAYGLGVSRLHVMVQKTESGYEISDMESTNGTWLNEQEVLPNRFYPVSSGDCIRMGKMYVSVLFLAKNK
jgi:pSer/pThr/pTyr-binding forkhead associated (FHA) protein